MLANLFLFNLYSYIWEIFKAKFFECLEAPLVYQQAFLPISKGGVGFVYVEVITPSMYLGNWGLVAPIVASRFLQNNHPILIKGYKG
jgi:hypothetical protein